MNSKHLINSIITVSLIISGCVGKDSENKENDMKTIENSTSSNTVALYKGLSARLLESDSIIIVSHESTNQPGKNSITGKTTPPPALIIEGRPNKSIIHENKKLDSRSTLLLENILTASSADSGIAMTCFQPRHAVFIYKNDSLSYFDFCFDCFNYSASSDISDRIIFDEIKWKNLQNFFKSEGFEYELY